ncbi:putative bifunctional diguanylate cyclase/phosphodiesterase [Mycolicibacterium arseniciresistens]|uniref:Bifunctional diguanylate cyclase/phosphodiesterase n=1 Tax=Mycolicibacterium arseniciresistens TaxID=3062257 RepID=A0ABT8UQ73_9MYCO|nr:bifunctional diguanylate cyclase/phosphodiesterase [Mycolicibacterium arseniciresistens]MDO3639951.1 bifunctional diguanylate cyclase/phosphodiesterase [Mycolicibacterium arseniciresistens]
MRLRSRRTIVVATALCTAVGVWTVAGWGGPRTVLVMSDLAFVVLGMFSTGCAVLAVRATRGRQRAAWLALTVGLLGWTVGEVLWSYYELLLDRSPFPSIADAAYLVFPVGAGLALLLFPVGHTGQSRTRFLLDGLIVAGSLFVVSWVTVLRRVYEAGGESLFSLSLSLAYPVSDLVVLTVAVLVLGRTRAGQRLPLVLVAVGVAFMAISDSGFAYQIAEDTYYTGIFDLGWLAGLLITGIAALVGRDAAVEDADVPQIPSRASALLPYVPLLMAAVLGTVDFLPHLTTGPVVPVALSLVLAVLLRQFVVVTENRRLLSIVAEQALRDPLTGLANYALFNDRLTHAMQLRQRDDRAVALLSLDLNDFKLVNDSLGHPAGDALLMRVAERLVGCVRTGDTVARLGGDEFAVLLEGRVDHSHRVAHRVVEAFDEPFVIDGQQLLMRPSVGLAVASFESQNDEPDLTADILFKQADLAMYTAKRSRTGGVHVFSSEMALVYPEDAGWNAGPGGTRGGGADAVRLLGELRHAIDHYGLTLVYQPKIDLQTGEVVGAEALLRWPHPQRGMLSPDEFLPLVRTHGLMAPITRLVLNMALDDVARWYRAGLGVPVAINLFAPAVADVKLPARIAEALEHRRLPPDALTVEITEDLLLDNIGRTRSVLNDLRERGIRVAIDDFGSGYSALSYLRELPIDEVKLDRRLIAPVTSDPRAAAVVRAVVNLTHVLGMVTVAEGVEDAETADLLREYGCGVAQGFHFSAPVDSATMLDLLARGVSPAAAAATSG